MLMMRGQVRRAIAGVRVRNGLAARGIAWLLSGGGTGGTLMVRVSAGDVHAS